MTAENLVPSLNILVETSFSTVNSGGTYFIARIFPQGPYFLATNSQSQMISLGSTGHNC
jgi:hypothetical protein